MAPRSCPTWPTASTDNPARRRSRLDPERHHTMSDIPYTSRAAALVAPGEPLEIIDVTVPEAIEEGAILVRMLAATLCGTDVHVRAGAVRSGSGDHALPLILGHEMVGEIVAF